MTELAAASTSRRSLSPSRAGDFQNCPLLYRFRTIDRLPEPAEPPMVRGTLVHAVLEELFGDPAPGRTLDRAVELLPSQWEKLRTSEPRLAELFTPEQAADETAWLASCITLLETYFAMEDPRRLEPAAREERVSYEHGEGVRFGGIVDRIDIAPDGRIRVVDYKTGRAPDPRYEDKAMFQMRFYALVIWRTRGVVPALLQLMYLGDGSFLRYEPTTSDLLATEKKLLALWAAIERAIELGDFPPRRSGLCRWCAHQALCPEFGGTPPPLVP
ncbi:RecB family exonuclease [Aeromicrobium wangtongii]|uniref:RecB family exonuclease n=1 Tax=Aeromicrobium wangtongii TaxID=2969247 RepID=A0ABY5M2K3_9ACTN|nr:RecB family exonuclease [Aeromicrobium wangtongii]MCD9198040.1 RecB family exonuclease [Aeromicrobium wangtongii]UUP12082.1 RecB family exonuclease [Aeromicrobium wangtongii]